MSTVVRMPQLGESVVEGTVARWLKQPGDSVTKREPLLEISTDKIDTEVPAPVDGVLLEIVAAAGITVKAGAPLAYIGEDGAAPDTAAAHPADATAAVVAAASAPTVGEAVATLPPAVNERPAGRAFVSPVVTRMVAEHGLDLAQINGTGLGGRVTRKDVEAHLSRQAIQSVLKTAERAADEADSLAPTFELGDILAPLTTMRRAIAQHMVMSKRTSPHVTSFFEVDMTAVVRHREANKRRFADKGIALTYTAYFMAAIVAGIKEAPLANARFTDEGIILHRRIHLGVAVALREGLVVPVLRDADEKNLQGLARSLNDMVEKARSGKYTADDLHGGTFTLTNHGTGGSLFATPIINQPQTGILGVGAIAKRPVVRTSSASLLPSVEDALVIRPMCYLSFSIDHRVLDGAQADAFLTAMKRRLENWE